MLKEQISWENAEKLIITGLTSDEPHMEIWDGISFESGANNIENFSRLKWDKFCDKLTEEFGNFQNINDFRAAYITTQHMLETLTYVQCRQHLYNNVNFMYLRVPFNHPDWWHSAFGIALFGFKSELFRQLFINEHRVILGELKSYGYYMR